MAFPTGTRAAALITTSNWEQDIDAASPCSVAACSTLLCAAAASASAPTWPCIARLHPSTADGGPAELLVAVAGPEDAPLSLPLSQLRVATSARAVEVWAIPAVPGRQRSFSEMAAAGLRGDYIATISLRDAAPVAAPSAAPPGEGGPPSLVRFA